MANIKIHLHYASGYCNGWPLINIYINNQWIDAFEANNIERIIECEIDPGPVTLMIEHWGKNPITDSGNPDKFFDLKGIDLNNTKTNFLLSDSEKIVKADPWNLQHEVTRGDNYLGHNGTLHLFFESPVEDWLKRRQGNNDRPIRGQETSNEVLLQAKKFFNIQRRL